MKVDVLISAFGYTRYYSHSSCLSSSYAIECPNIWEEIVEGILFCDSSDQ